MYHYFNLKVFIHIMSIFIKYMIGNSLVCICIMVVCTQGNSQTLRKRILFFSWGTKIDKKG